VSERLDESLTHPPLVLPEQHAAQLREADGRIIEHSQDRLAIGDRERDEILLAVQRGKKCIARVLEAGRVQEPSKGGNVHFVDGNTGKSHASRATQRRDPQNGGVA
jgi:hypothetical protein